MIKTKTKLDFKIMLQHNEVKNEKHLKRKMKKVHKMLQ